MTIEDVFKKCAEIERFPLVSIEEKVRHAESNIGQITQIKSSGIAVRFEGMTWDSWFWRETQDDKRSKYMSQLSFVD